MQIHPAADMFPSMTESELDELTTDIQVHGQIVPIVLYRGDVLDGRSRLRVCIKLGLLPKTVEWDGDGSPAEFAWSMNGSRRHLTASQKAAVATGMLALFEAEAKERQREHGGTAPGRPTETLGVIVPQVSGDRAPRARDHAAAVVGVSPRYVSDAKRVKDEDPELFEEVKNGNVTLPVAISEIKQRAESAVESQLDGAIDTVPGAAEKLHRARLKSAVARGVMQATELFRLNPSSVAEVISQEDYSAITLMESNAEAWFKSLAAARSSGLRLIRGKDYDGQAENDMATPTGR